MAQEPRCSSDNDTCQHVDELTTLRARVRELEDRIEQLQQLVRTDALTGLYNHRYFREALRIECERTKRMNMDFCLVLADIDHFKSVNDNYGHEIGNLVLQHTAKLIKDTIRPMDLPCRYGGEEFAILLPSTSLLTSVQVAERLRNTLATSEIMVDDHSLKVTASFGICGFSADSELTEDQLIATADKQLYAAKNAGRDKVCYEPAAPSKRPQVSQDEKDLLSGLFDNDD